MFFEGVYFVSREAEENLKVSQGQKALKKNLERIEKVATLDMIAFKALHKEKIESYIKNYSYLGQTLEISIKFIKVRVYKYLEDYIMRTFPGLVEISYDFEIMIDRCKMLIKRFFKY